MDDATPPPRPRTWAQTWARSRGTPHLGPRAGLSPQSQSRGVRGAGGGGAGRARRGGGVLAGFCGPLCGRDTTAPGSGQRLCRPARPHRRRLRRAREIPPAGAIVCKRTGAGRRTPTARPESGRPRGASRLPRPDALRFASRALGRAAGARVHSRYAAARRAPGPGGGGPGPESADGDGDDDDDRDPWAPPTRRGRGRGARLLESDPHHSRARPARASRTRPRPPEAPGPPPLALLGSSRAAAARPRDRGTWVKDPPL